MQIQFFCFFKYPPKVDTLSSDWSWPPWATLRFSSAPSSFPGSGCPEDSLTECSVLTPSPPDHRMAWVWWPPSPGPEHCLWPSDDGLRGQCQCSGWEGARRPPGPASCPRSLTPRPQCCCSWWAARALLDPGGSSRRNLAEGSNPSQWSEEPSLELTAEQGINDQEDGSWKNLPALYARYSKCKRRFVRRSRGRQEGWGRKLKDRSPQSREKSREPPPVDLPADQGLGSCPPFSSVLTFENKHHTWLSPWGLSLNIRHNIHSISDTCAIKRASSFLGRSWKLVLTENKHVITNQMERQYQNDGGREVQVQ